MTAQFPSSQVTAASGAGAVTSTTALAKNDDRNGWSIQNQSTNILYVYLAAGASSSVYHFTLKACTVTADGSGGSVGQEQGVIYTGVITIAGTNPSYSVVEF